MRERKCNLNQNLTSFSKLSFSFFKFVQTVESVHWTRCCSNSSNQKFSSEYQFHLIKTDFCWSQKDCNCNGYFFSKYIFTKLAFNRICANNRQKEGNYHCESHSICKTRANDLQILQPICFGTPICIALRELHSYTL